MINKTLYIMLFTALVLSSTTTWAYNQDLAASYYKLFQPVTGAKAGKELHLIKPDAFIEDLKKGKRYVVIDARTPAELFVYTVALPGSLRIPVNQLFTAKNLDLLPKENPIIITCKSGARATAAGTALRHIGFNNVYILKGGFKGLVAYLDPKVANAPSKAEEKSTK